MKDLIGAIIVGLYLMVVLALPVILLYWVAIKYTLVFMILLFIGMGFVIFYLKEVSGRAK